MPSYFQEFPIVSYTLSTGESIFVRDIFHMTDVDETLSENSLSYTKVSVLAGERPDQLSTRLYGTPDYHWTFFIVNDFLRDAGWPASSDQLEEYAVTHLDQYSVLLTYPIITSQGTRYNDVTSMIMSDAVGIRFVDGGDADFHSYDANLLQLWVKNITGGDPFQNSQPEFTFFWKDDSQIEARSEWVTSVMKNLRDCGNEYAIQLGASLDNGLIDHETYLNTSYTYISENLVFRALDKWRSARDAAAKYTIVHDDRVISISAYDSYQFGAVNSYISNFDALQTDNFRRCQLRIVRPDKITDFISQWKATK